MLCHSIFYSLNCSELHEEIVLFAEKEIFLCSILLTAPL